MVDSAAEQNAKDHSKLANLIFSLPLLLMAFFFVFYLVERPNWTLAQLTLMALFAALYGCVLLFRRGVNPLSFTLIYGMYLVLSHLGLVGSHILIPNSIESFREKIGQHPSIYQGWFYGHVIDLSVAVAGLAITIYFFSAIFWLAFTDQHETRLISLQEKGSRPFFFFGRAMLVLCTVYIIVMGVSGILPFFSYYGEYFAAAEQAPGYAFFLLFFAIGTTFVVATGDITELKQTAIWYLIPSGLLLLSGNRGEVLYGTAASVAILGNRGFSIKPQVILLGLVVFFGLIPLIRQVRNIDFSERSISFDTISLTEPFIELGFQIRPLGETLRWIENGEAFANGGTYWLPIQRILALVFPIMERQALEGNRFFISERLPTQGYSVIAEAYFNFGLWGNLVMILLSYLFFRFSLVQNSAHLATVGSISQILINNQRNSFLFVPGQLLIVFTIAVLLLAWPRLTKSKVSVNEDHS